MYTVAGYVRSIDPWIVGLLRRSLVVAGLLFGFLLAGSALAHAQGHAPGHGSPHPPNPGHGNATAGVPSQPLLPSLAALPPIGATIPAPVVAPVTKAVTPVTKAVAPVVTQLAGTVTKTVQPVSSTLRSITIGLGTTVVRTINPVVRPAVGVTVPRLGPVLLPVLDPLSGGPPMAPESGAATPDPDTDGALSPPAPVPATPVTALTNPVRPIAPQVNGPPAESFLLSYQYSFDDRTAASGGGPYRKPDPPGGPLADVMGAGSNGAGGPHGPATGIDRPNPGAWPDLFSPVRVRPGTGPPKWWFFDPHHHPS